MIYHEKSGIFNTTEKDFNYGELRKLPRSKIYLNSLDRRDFMSIRSGQKMKQV